jgi:hypothetical protein
MDKGCVNISGVLQHAKWSYTKEGAITYIGIKQELKVHTDMEVHLLKYSWVLFYGT